MTIHVLVIYGNEVCTQLVKSVIDKLKYQLVLPPVMLMVAMAMEGEPREIECKLHLINEAVIWNACPKVYFHLWWLCEGSVKNIKSDISYPKTSLAFDVLIHSRALLAAQHSLLVGDSVGITSSCSLLAFPLSVNLTSLCLRCLYYSRTHNCTRLLIVATQSRHLNIC